MKRISWGAVVPGGIVNAMVFDSVGIFGTPFDSVSLLAKALVISDNRWTSCRYWSPTSCNESNSDCCNCSFGGSPVDWRNLRMVLAPPLSVMEPVSSLSLASPSSLSVADCVPLRSIDRPRPQSFPSMHVLYGRICRLDTVLRCLRDFQFRLICNEIGTVEAYQTVCSGWVARDCF